MFCLASVIKRSYVVVESDLARPLRFNEDAVGFVVQVDEIGIDSSLNSTVGTSLLLNGGTL